MTLDQNLKAHTAHEDQKECGTRNGEGSHETLPAVSPLEGLLAVSPSQGLLAASPSQGLVAVCPTDDLPTVCQSDDLPAVCQSDVVVQCSPATPDSSDSKSSVAMSIITSGMQFRLDTVVDHSREALELAAKLELALALLSLNESKLENAMIKIGQLQAQLLQTQLLQGRLVQAHSLDAEPE